LADIDIVTFLEELPWIDIGNICKKPIIVTSLDKTCSIIPIDEIPISTEYRQDRTLVQKYIAIGEDGRLYLNTSYYSDLYTPKPWKDPRIVFNSLYNLIKELKVEELNEKKKHRRRNKKARKKIKCCF
jgi:hypothetical protein